jgi:hypothetical protein
LQAKPNYHDYPNVWRQNLSTRLMLAQLASKQAGQK